MNIPVIGFWPSFDGTSARGYCEFDGVKTAGNFGKYTLVTDFATNYRFHSSVSYNTRVLKQTLVKTKSMRTYNPAKKYVALIMQESGDSTGYLQFRFRSAQWGDPNRGKVPISYGLSPLVLKLMPAMAEYLYLSATANDYFYTSISGLG